jgi:hypothetical protein
MNINTYVCIFVHQSISSKAQDSWITVHMHTQASVKYYTPMYLDLTLKISTWWVYFWLLLELGTQVSWLLCTLHPNSSLICKCIYWVLFFYIRYLILTASSLVSLLHKYFKLLAKAKFEHWKFWDSQTPHIWFHIINLASNIEPYKIHTHTHTHLSTLSDFAFLTKNKKVNIHN